METHVIGSGSSYRTACGRIVAARSPDTKLFVHPTHVVRNAPSCTVCHSALRKENGKEQYAAGWAAAVRFIEERLYAPYQESIARALDLAKRGPR